MLLSPAVGILALVMVGVILLVALAGRWRRSHWRRRIQEMERAEQGLNSQQARRAESVGRASDFLSRQLLRISNVVTLVSALILTVLPYVRVGATPRLALWVAFTVLTYGGALLLIYYWQGWDDDLEQVLRRKLLEAQERELARRGLPIRDPQTGLYTVEFWLHTLEGQVRRPFRRARPTSCLVIEVAGIQEFAVLYSDLTVWHVLKMIGGAIASNVRPYDVVCRSGASRFAVGLLRCPAPNARVAGERIAANVSRLVLRGVNQGYGTRVQLRWSSATMPGDATTPIQLLHVTEHPLDQVPLRLPAEREATPSSSSH